MCRARESCASRVYDLQVRDASCRRVVFATSSPAACCTFHRVGHHSTSDDSFAYRARQEVEDRKRMDNPLARLRLFLESRGWWDAEEEEALKAKQKRDVLEAFRRAEVLPRWELKELFEDVYGGETPWNIVSLSNNHWIHVLTLRHEEGAEGRARSAVAKIWQRLGTVAEGIGEIQRKGGRINERMTIWSSAGQHGAF